jgi:high-affinity iron transporter
MKLKFSFILAGASLVALLAGGLSGCKSATAVPQAASASDGGDAQRLVSLIDYIAGDYGRAVQAGKVVSEFEYQEQVRFASDARKMASALLDDAAGPEPALLGALARVEAEVAAKADAEAVAAGCRTAREEAVQRFGLRTMPGARPSLPRAQDLYAQSCAACHGAEGAGDGPQAAGLEPAPADFRDPERLALLSPYRVYNALTFGVPGTGMASFDTLPPEDRWSLAFYVFRLGHAGRPAAGPTGLGLADLAGLNDREILETLRAEPHASPEAALAYARREAAFVEPPMGIGLDRTRRLVRQAVAAQADGRAQEADRLVLDAYLQGFEPLEPRLRARDAQATLAVETGFRDLRAALAGGDGAAVGARAVALDRRLQAAARSGRPAVPFAAAFLIYLREGLEAALLVGALLAGLRRLGRSDAARYLHLGWLAAIPAGVLTWILAERLIALGAERRELIEGAVALLAAAVLFCVSFWLISKAESRHWSGYLRQSLESGLGRRHLLLLPGLAFLAVYREAAETVLFTQALLLESEAQRAQVWGGAAAGLLAVCAVAYLMAGTVRRLPLGPFFAVSGTLLCLLAVSFAGSGVYALVASGFLPPRPISFLELPWLGIHPDLTGLLVQLAIVAIVAGAGLQALGRKPALAAPRLPSPRARP